jgi:hypothetical protein
MKALMILITVVFYFTAANGQETPKKTAAGKEDKELKIVIKMQGGKVFESKNGKDTPLAKPVDINGIRVNTDGTLAFKDGHNEVLKDGDVILENGLVLRDGGQSYTDPANK